RAARVGEEVDDPGISGLSRGRQALQVAEASSAHAVQHDAGAIPRQMGPAAGLPDGGAELRGGAFTTRQENGPRPAGAEAEVDPSLRAKRCNRKPGGRCGLLRRYALRNDDPLGRALINRRSFPLRSDFPHLCATPAIDARVKSGRRTPSYKLEGDAALQTASPSRRNIIYFDRLP